MVERKDSSELFSAHQIKMRCILDQYVFFGAFLCFSIPCPILSKSVLDFSTKLYLSSQRVVEEKCQLGGRPKELPSESMIAPDLLLIHRPDCWFV